MNAQLKTLSQLWHPFAKQNIHIYSASTCYYFLLSAFPALILFFFSIPLLPVPSSFWATIAQEIFPSAFLPLLSALYYYIASSGSVTIVSLSVLSLLWSASKAVLSIMDGLNFTLNFSKHKNFILRRILSIFYLFLLGVSFIFILSCLVFANLLIQVISIMFPALYPLWQRIFLFRGIISSALLSGIFCLLYHFLPTGSLPWKYCMISSLLTALGWIGLSALFSLYVENFANYDQVYGYLGLIILGMIWLRTCITLLLSGGLLAKLLSDGKYKPLKIIQSAFRGI